MSAALTFKPVTDKNVSDFETLFGRRGGPNWCWCMAFRASPNEIKDSKSASRKAQMLSRIHGGEKVGLIGYDGDEPVAWISVAPKETFRSLGGAEGEKIWSITCMFIARTHRGQGLSPLLVAAAAKEAKKHKAKILEAYPVDPDSPSYRHMGFVPLFENAGFDEQGREGKRRHVMHLPL